MMRINVIFTLCILTRLAAGQLEYHPEDALNLHNLYRSRQGASNMKMMTWDQDLAEEAAAYAVNCAFEHDRDRGNLGENMYIFVVHDEEVNHTKRAIEAWYEEYKNYDTSTFQCSGGDCEQFTQIIWANSERLGCAANVNCGLGQNPFIPGSECSNCDAGWGNCVDGLCAKDDMIEQSSTTEASTAISNSTDPNPTPTSTSGSTTLLSTGNSSDSTTATTQEPTTVTGDPSEPNPHHGCSAEYREELRHIYACNENRSISLSSVI